MAKDKFEIEYKEYKGERLPIVYLIWEFEPYTSPYPGYPPLTVELRGVYFPREKAEKVAEWLRNCNKERDSTRRVYVEERWLNHIYGQSMLDALKRRGESRHSSHP